MLTTFTAAFRGYDSSFLMFLRALATMVVALLITLLWSSVAFFAGVLYVPVRVIHLATCTTGFNLLWVILRWYAVWMQLTYRMMGASVCTREIVRIQQRQAAGRQAQRLRILIANHPDTPLVPALILAMIRRYGPVSVVVKAGLLITPVATGWLIGIFTCILRVRHPWFARLRLWSFKQAIRYAILHGVSLVIFPDQHRFSHDRRAQIIARYKDQPFGRLAEELEHVLPPHVGGLWELLKVAREMGIAVQVVDFTIFSSAGHVSMHNLHLLAGGRICISSQDAAGVADAQSRGACSAALNALWRQKNARMQKK